MNPPKSAVRAVSCPNCGGALEVRAAGWSVNLACQYCGSILDVSRPEVQIIERHNRAAAGFPLPLGSRGNLFETEWEVIGALGRSDAEAGWREYLLFNPYVGYRWLVEYDGDWQFGTMLLDRPQENDGSVQWRGQRFRQEGEAGLATVDTVIGEFYWRIESGDRALCASYTCRDFTLSREEADGGINWTQLVALADGHVETAFGVSEAASQPAPDRTRARFAGSWKSDLERNISERRDADQRSDFADIPGMLGLSLLTIVAALILMLGFAGRSAEVASEIKAPFGRTAEGIRLGTITVVRPWQFVSIKANARSLNNQWVDLDYSLVDRATGQSVDAYGIVERYRGRDSDGSWSEGSRKTTTQFGQIPKGTYDVFVDAGAHNWPIDVRADGAPSPWGVSSGSYSGDVGASGKPDPIPVEVVVKTNTVPKGNFWTLFVFALFIPAIPIYRGWKNR